MKTRSLRVGSHDLVERLSGIEQIDDIGIHFAVALVVQQRAVFVVEQDEPVVHALDGISQQGHGLSSLGLTLTKCLLGVLSAADIQ